MGPRKKPNRDFVPFKIEPGDDLILQKIPAQYRDALSAVSDHGLGLAYADAAAHLGVTVGTVKSRVSRAKDMVRVARAQAQLDKEVVE